MHWFWRATVGFFATVVATTVILVLSFAALTHATGYVLNFLKLGDNRSAQVVFMLMIAVIGATVALAFNAPLWWISHRRDAETRCRKCGYILRGISEPRCPECGERI